MSSLINKAIENIRQSVCNKQNHDHQPIIRICVNELCYLNDNIECALCADCLIDHTNHYQDCIKLDQFFTQCKQNASTTNEISIEKLELTIEDLNHQSKSFRKKVKEMQTQFKKQFKKNFKDQVIEELQLLQSKHNNQKEKQNVNYTLRNLVKEYIGLRNEESLIDYTALFNKTLKQSEEELNTLLKEITNTFTSLNQKIDQKLNDIKEIIQNYGDSEVVLEKEENQKNVIQQISLSQQELTQQIRVAEVQKENAQKELKKLQDQYFDIQEQEKILFYKIEQKKKLDSESKRSFMQKIQNLMEKQINIKYLEEQRIQADAELHSQMFLGINDVSPNKKYHDSALLIQDQDQSLQQISDQIVYQLQFGIQDIIEDQRSIDNSIQNDNQINHSEKEKYSYIEKTKLFLQQRQEYYAEFYSKELQILQNFLVELQTKKENYAQDLEKSRINYYQQAQNLKQLQLQQYQNEDLKYSEKKKMLDLYKKSPIKRKVLNF